MPHRTATYPSDALLSRYAEGCVRVSTVATPPCKSVIYNALCTLSLAREGAMRRGCWASHVEGALSAHGGHEYARISFYQQMTQREQKKYS